jgi:hypothetical protein
MKKTSKIPIALSQSGGLGLIQTPPTLFPPANRFFSEPEDALGRSKSLGFLFRVQLTDQQYGVDGDENFDSEDGIPF